MKLKYKHSKKRVNLDHIKPTVTVALSAFNEEKNIVQLLKSVLKQEQKSFILKKILVISDGSTDNTVSKIRSIKSKLIEVREYKKRIGKSARLNEIYKDLESDYLVQSDADVMFSHSKIIENIVTPMILEKNVGMCGGNTQPLPGVTFNEKAVNVTHPIFSEFRETVRGGNNWFSASGRLLAFSKKMIKKVKIPDDTIGNDRYVYLSCLVLGYKYKYVQKAVVYFRSSQTLKEHIYQNTRFLAIPLRMMKYFEPALVKKETYIPQTLLAKGLAIQLLKHPILFSYIFLVNRYCQLRAAKTEKQLNSLWEIASTTKTLN